jgi:hypothetical protein
MRISKREKEKENTKRGNNFRGRGIKVKERRR